MSALTFNDRLLKMSDGLGYFALSLTKNREDADDLLAEKNHVWFNTGEKG